MTTRDPNTVPSNDEPAQHSARISSSDLPSVPALKEQEGSISVSEIYERVQSSSLVVQLELIDAAQIAHESIRELWVESAASLRQLKTYAKLNAELMERLESEELISLLDDRERPLASLEAESEDFSKLCDNLSFLLGALDEYIEEEGLVVSSGDICFSGQRFFVSGGVPGFNRVSLVKRLEELGATVSPELDEASVDYVVLGGNHSKVVGELVREQKLRSISARDLKEALLSVEQSEGL